MRTIQQNKALHKYFEMLADQMNEAGFDIHTSLPKIEVPWTKEIVKECLWKPVQKASLNKTSTTELDTKEIDKVFEIINRWLSAQGLQVDFPSIDQLIDYETD